MSDDVKGIEMALNYVMPWGKYGSHKLKNIPNHYLRWIARECDNNTVAMMADIVIRWREKYGIEE